MHLEAHVQRVAERSRNFYQAEAPGHFLINVHVHNEKMHFVPQLTQMPQLALLEVSHDPKTPKPICDLPRIYEMTGHANLLLAATSAEVRQFIEPLKQRNVFLEVECRDRADAADLITFVRKHSKPLL